MHNKLILIILIAFNIPILSSCKYQNIKLENYISQSDSYSQQGAAAYDKYLFQFTDLGVCDIYDLKKRKHIGQTKYEASKIKHCDTACFGFQKFKKTDRFPVLYVSGSQIGDPESCGVIWAYRILQDHNIWQLQLVQTIRTPKIKDVGICPDAVVSHEEGVLWLMGWHIHKDIDAPYGGGSTLKLSKFKLPSLTAGEIGLEGVPQVMLTTDIIIDSFEVSGVHKVQQGICLCKDTLYVPYGDSALGYQGIDLIDLMHKAVVRNIDLMNTSVKEPEAVFFYNGSMYIADQATTIKKVIKY